MSVAGHYPALTAFRQSVTIVLVLLYGLGSLRIESLHQLVHHEESVLHSPEQEQNACHRTIFHFNVAAQCSHETHVSSLWKCPFCDLHFTAHDTPETIAAITAARFNEIPFTVISCDRLEGAATHAPARAPPIG